MIEGQEKERKKIAEDLHDNLGSTLATLKLHFDNYRENLSVDDEKQIKMLDSTENILDLAYSKVRTMAHANHASVLAEHSLVEAVKSLAFNISSANKTEIEVIDFGFDKPLNHTIELTMFRIIQELITNIIKHAKAKKGTIDLTLFDDSLGLIVEDDGVGFNINDLSVKVEGMGLNSIKSRVEKMNGSFAIDTNLDVGTTILIDIPIKSEI
jgi:signal transduction histidine kinase